MGVSHPYALSCKMSATVAHNVQNYSFHIVGIACSIFLALILRFLRTSSPQKPIIPARIPRLPVEVCERIIDYVNASFVGFNHETDKDRQETLSACALTCRDWRPRSQLHLYHFLVLDDPRQFERFTDTLRRNSDLATYICDMSFRGNREGKSFPSGIEHWTSLVSLHLNSLPNLDRISLKWCDWRNLHPSFFVMVSSVTNITRLWLAGVQVRTSRELVYFVHSFPNVAELRLHDVYCTKVVPYARNKRTRRTIPLQSLIMDRNPTRSPESHDLKLETTGALLHSLYDTASCREIKVFKAMAIEKTTQLELDRAFDGFTILEDLTLFLAMDSLNLEIEEHFNLEKCVYLRHLRIKYAQVPSSNIAFLSQTLSTVRSSTLKTITINLEETRKDITLFDGVDWVSLDTVLDAPRFRSLTDVTVGVMIMTDIAPDFVEKRLPLLHARKILTSAIRLQ